MRKPGRRVVGACYRCDGPVYPHEARRVLDVAVTAQLGRSIFRLAHRGECEAEVRFRVGGQLRLEDQEPPAREEARKEPPQQP